MLFIELFLLLIFDADLVFQFCYRNNLVLILPCFCHLSNEGLNVVALTLQQLFDVVTATLQEILFHFHFPHQLGRSLNQSLFHFYALH